MRDMRAATRAGHSLASALTAEKNASTVLSIIVPTYPLHFRKAIDLVRSVRLNVRSARRVPRRSASWSEAVARRL